MANKASAETAVAAFPSPAEPFPSGETHPSRAPRQRTLIGAVLGAEGMAGQEAIIRNVSKHGMCIASRGFAPHRGQMLEVMLPSGIELDAEVRWVGVGEFGVLLSESIDLSRLDISSMHRNSGFVSIMNWVLDRHFHRAQKDDDDLIRRC